MPSSYFVVFVFAALADFSILFLHSSALTRAIMGCRLALAKFNLKGGAWHSPSTEIGVSYTVHTYIHTYIYAIHPPIVCECAFLTSSAFLQRSKANRQRPNNTKASSLFAKHIWVKPGPSGISLERIRVLSSARLIIGGPSAAGGVSEIFWGQVGPCG